MNIEIMQTLLGIVTFVTFVLAARTGLSPGETGEIRRGASSQTEFIKR